MEPAASFEIRTRRWGLRRMSWLRTMRGGGDLHEFDHQLDVCGFSEANLNPVAQRRHTDILTSRHGP